MKRSLLPGPVRPSLLPPLLTALLLAAVLSPPLQPAIAAEPTGGTLEQAYQKEYAYLNAEQKELEGRLAEIDRESASRVAAEESALDALQARLVARARQADRAEDTFDALERETATMDDASVLLGNTLQQGHDTLGMTLVKGSDPSVVVPAVFATAAQQIAAANAIGIRDGSFFLPDGREVTGKVYAWGQIGAWGIADGGAGSLAPVGDGHMQPRREFGGASASALGAGQTPDRLEVYLFEPERKTDDTEKAGGLAQVLNDAGTMGQILFGLGCVSAALALVRALTLLFARRGGMPLVVAVTDLVARGDVKGAGTLLSRRGGPLARILKSILDHADRPREELERVVDEAILRETPLVDRFASALVVITAGAPLLGLLGTVTGMIATFDVITEHGTGNPKLMSAGIAEALVCTALGLAVAIPTLLVGNVLASVSGAIKNTLDRGALTLQNALELRRSENVETRSEAPARVPND